MKSKFRRFLILPNSTKFYALMSGECQKQTLLKCLLLSTVSATIPIYSNLMKIAILAIYAR